MHKRVLIMFGVVLLAFAGVATACKTDTTDLKNRIATVEQQQASVNQAVPTLRQSAQNTGIVLALDALAGAGIHEFATSVDAGTLPPGESGPIQRALAAISAAHWPPELQSLAKDMQTKLSDLLTALASGDITKIRAPADAAHEANDTFPDAVYEKLAGSLGLPTSPAATPGAGG